jgi:NTP pyrophosphatase (non-canonical NTP hydrolase)
MSTKQHYVEHLYGVLQEECAELIMAISKRERFGGNDEGINHEINDIMAVVEMLAQEGEKVYDDFSLQIAKVDKVNKYYIDTFNKDFPIPSDRPLRYLPSKIGYEFNPEEDEQ